MSSEQTLQPIAPSGEVELNDDSGRSFVITRRNGTSYEVWVSVADYDRVMAAGPWHVLARSDKPCVYVQRKTLHGGVRRNEYLHHFVLGSRDEVDHRNCSGLDNRRSNLRPASTAENQMNKAPTHRSSSQLRGVFWYAQNGKWVARISAGGARYYIGVFADRDEAALAYEGVARILHGDFYRPSSGGVGG